MQAQGGAGSKTRKLERDKAFTDHVFNCKHSAAPKNSHLHNGSMSQKDQVEISSIKI